MKKTGVINAPMAAVIAELGHMDMIAIADAGLPIPGEVLRIDLALKEGVPGFVETLGVVLTEMQVEKAILAEEIKEHNPAILKEIENALGDAAIEFITHEDFKRSSKDSKAIIRTGEFSPYANIILVSGVIF
jgi:D-ribose pyranase